MKAKKNNNNEKVKSSFLANQPHLRILLKSLFVFVFFFILIFYIDSKGYFAADQTNNHTKRKWDSYYEFTKTQNVDILLLGNSHVYSGINPKNLSAALGCNAFILAAPGISIIDSYFTLKEAVKKSKMKCVVLETYGLDNSNPYEYKNSALTDQIKSFSSRKNLKDKIFSMPELFRMENYLYAWSQTLRNHDFIFNDPQQLETNRKIINNEIIIPNKNALYLGRFVAYNKGIEDKLLKKYDSLGAPVIGEKYEYSSFSELYLQKIVDLCEKEKIQLIFLTLPMYHKHISNYDQWEKKLSNLLNKYPYPWVNMQKEPYYSYFDLFAFQNTYKANQHMTYNGSLVATYLLANFVKDNPDLDLPNRKRDIEWHRIFYGHEGYFENFLPSKNDPNNFIICRNKTFGNIQLNSVLQLKIDNSQYNRMLAKVKKDVNDENEIKNKNLRLNVKYEHQGEQFKKKIDLEFDAFHHPKEDYIFATSIPLVKIIEVENAILLPHSQE